VVTAGLLASRKITSREAVEYWIGQAVGAILAALALFIVIMSRARLRGSVLHGFLFAGERPIPAEESAVAADPGPRGRARR
jgi:hypothetical protein